MAFKWPFFNGIWLVIFTRLPNSLSKKLRFQLSFLLQDLLTLLTVKSALFEFELKALQNYLVKIIFGFLGSEYLNLVANFESY